MSWFRWWIMFAVMALVAGIGGYFLSYSWFFYGDQEGLSLNTFKGQLNAERVATDVENKLREKGYDFDSNDFYLLKSPFQSAQYQSDVLGGFEAVKKPFEEGQESYLFYAKDGTAYYMENKDAEPMPLIAE